MDDQFGCGNPWVDPRTRWPAAPGPLRVRIGRTTAREPMLLELEPHVLITGSPGKTALFRTVLATDPELARLLVRALDDEVWRRNNLAEHELGGEPALVVAIDDADRAVAAAIPGLLDVLTEVGGSGARPRMHLLLTAGDSAGLTAGRRISLHHGGGQLDGVRFEPEAIDPRRLDEFVASFHLYRHPARSLWEPPKGLTYDRLLRYDRPRDGEILLGVRSNGYPRTLRFDFADRAHLLLSGPSEEDNRAVLHTVLRRIAERYGPDGAIVVPAGQANVRAVLSRRLADRASWTGPEIFVVAHRGDSLGPMAALLRHGASIGVHLIAVDGDRSCSDAVPAEDRLELRIGPGGQVIYRAGPEQGTAQIALDDTGPVRSTACPCRTPRRAGTSLWRSGGRTPPSRSTSACGSTPGAVGTPGPASPLCSNGSPSASRPGSRRTPCSCSWPNSAATDWPHSPDCRTPPDTSPSTTRGPRAGSATCSTTRSGDDRRGGGRCRTWSCSRTNPRTSRWSGKPSGGC